MNLYHHLDLLERPRTNLLRRAVESMVRPGDVVLDAGTGSGVLAVWAAQAGASRVVAVDRDHSGLVEDIARANGVGHIVEFHQADLRTADFGREFNVLTALLYENDPRRDEPVIGLGAGIAKRHLKPGGRSIPDSVRYLGIPLAWPAQDHVTWRGRTKQRIRTLSDQLGIDLAPLGDHTDSGLSYPLFPARAEHGRLKGDYRWLADPSTMVQYKCSDSDARLPPTWQTSISRAGVMTAVLWVQQLCVGDTVLFENESVTWLAAPHAAEPGDVLVFELDDVWRSSNLLTPNTGR